MKAQLFQVRFGNSNVITYAYGRENAKANAAKWLCARDPYTERSPSGLYPDPDKFVVTPLTEPGDRIHLDITVSA